MTDTCEKKLANQTACGQSGIYGVPDCEGQLHYFCGEHLWDKLPATEDEQQSQSCDMMGANPPSLQRCGWPAAFKHVGPFGDTKYWCARCRRKHFPTDEEKAADEAAETKAAHRDELLLTFVGRPIWWLLRLLMVGVAIYGLVAFIKWCWIHS
jgi:hypothetical protein